MEDSRLVKKIIGVSLMDPQIFLKGLVDLFKYLGVSPRIEQPRSNTPISIYDIDPRVKP